MSHNILGRWHSNTGDIPRLSRRWVWAFYLLSFTFYLLTSHLFAQQRLSDQATISLITVSPGSELYTTFGHSAFRIVDPVHNLDRIYNYGTFNFDEPGFYLKFCRGKLDYLLSAYRYAWAEEVYKSEQRGIIQQTLNLTPALRDYIYDFLEWNYLPQNRGYRYDFFFDNCATRLRDVFERTLGGDVQLYENPDRRMTFRQYIDQHLTSLPFSDYGIDLALGARTENIATAREAMFLPDYLYEAVEKGQVRHDGEWQPLVARLDTLHWTAFAAQPRSAPPWMAIILWIVFGFTAFITLRDYQRGANRPRWIDYLLHLVVGLIGVVLVLLWFATEHTTTADNWNLLWAWPSGMLIAVLMGIPRIRPWLGGYLVMYAVFLGITLAGWTFWPQDLHEANIPLILALMIRSLWLGKKTAKSEGQGART